MFSPLYLKIFEKSPFLMKTPTQNFAHHTEVKKHPFGVKTPILATLGAQYGIYLVSRKQHEIFLTHFLCSSVLVIFEKARILYNKNQNKND